MKIAILYICTGKYDVFWDGFYQSSEQYFLTNHEKHYFVFTDSLSIQRINDRIHLIDQETLGWPYNTLFRFKFFLKAETELEGFDYIYFLNANMRFVVPVGEEVFPTEEEDGLLAVLHPGYFKKTEKDFPYERNKLSLAYIKKGEGKYYFMGGFNGGKAKSYLKLINELNQNIESDISKNIIATWHDESHLNAYLLKKNKKILTPEYGFTEGGLFAFEPKIIILDKANFGGHSYLRNKDRDFPLISVLMPVYNGSLHIQEAVNSLLAQTYQNIEIIIIDDGSTDATLLILKQINDSRIKILALDKNGGIVRALNEGFKICKGEFIARMDCDDICEPDRLKKQYFFLTENPKIGICGSYQTIIGGYKDGINKTPISHENIIIDLLFRPTMLHPTVMMRTTILENLAKKNDGQLYNSSYILCEDYELWVRAANITQLANIPEPLCNYRWEREKNWEENNEMLINGLNQIWGQQLRKLNIPVNRFILYSHQLLSGRGRANLLSIPIVSVYFGMLFCNNLLSKQYNKILFCKSISRQLALYFNRVMISYAVGRWIKNIIKNKK